MNAPRNQEVQTAWEARNAEAAQAAARRAWWASHARAAVIVCGMVTAVLFFYCLLHSY